MAARNVQDLLREMLEAAERRDLTFEKVIAALPRDPEESLTSRQIAVRLRIADQDSAAFAVMIFALHRSNQIEHRQGRYSIRKFRRLYGAPNRD